MLPWFYYLLLFLVLLVGLVLNVLTLPGNWLMLAAVAVYAWVTHSRHYVGWVSLLVLFLLAAAAEVLELYASAAGVKSEGGSRRGSFGALIGGIVGGILLTGLIPIPILGTFIGILIGTFAGAVIGELTGGKAVGHSALIGVGAAKGRALGTLLKLAFGCMILVISLFVAIPWARQTMTVPVSLPGPGTPAAHASGR